MVAIMSQLARRFAVAMQLASCAAIAVLALNVGSLRNNLVALNYLALAAQPGVSSTDLPLEWPQFSRGDVLLARLALTEGDNETALAVAGDAARRGDRLAGFVVGQAYLQLGDHQNALELWAQTSDAESLRSAAQALSAEGHDENSLLFLQKAYELDDVGSTLLLSNLMHKQGNTTAAIDILVSALADHPDSSFRRVWMLSLVQLMRIQHDWNDAQVVLDTWEREFQADSYLFIQRGWLIFERDGDLQAAMNQIEKAISLAPNDGVGYLNMGILLARNSQHAQAEEYYARAVQLSPDNIGWLLTRAHNLQSLGDIPQAKAQYEAILRVDPQNGEAIQALGRLTAP